MCFFVLQYLYIYLLMIYFWILFYLIRHKVILNVHNPSNAVFHVLHECSECIVHSVFYLNLVCHLPLTH